MNYKNYADAFKALSDETRLEIVDMLSKGEICACRILESFEITQPTLSYHMKILCGCNLVKCRKQGSWIHYSLNRDMIIELRDFMSNIITEG